MGHHLRVLVPRAAIELPPGLRAAVAGALLLGSIIGLKAWRRRRRRNAESTSARFVGAWRELVDHARDLGQVVPLGPTVTRREQSAGIVSDGAAALARRADGFVFGPRVPEASAATAYWESVDAERRAMSHGVGRWHRLRAAVSLRSLRPGTATRRARGLADWRSRGAPD